MKTLADTLDIIHAIFARTDIDEMQVRRNTENTFPFDLRLSHPIEGATFKSLLQIVKESDLNLSMDRDGVYLR